MQFPAQLCHTGAVMEVNISHRIRQEILTTSDLTHPDLFTNALNELMQLMKMVGCLLGLHKFISGFPFILVLNYVHSCLNKLYFLL